MLCIVDSGQERRVGAIHGGTHAAEGYYQYRLMGMMEAAVYPLDIGRREWSQNRPHFIQLNASSRAITTSDGKHCTEEDLYLTAQGAAQQKHYVIVRGIHYKWGNGAMGKLTFTEVYHCQSPVKANPLTFVGAQPHLLTVTYTTVYCTFRKFFE